MTTKIVILVGGQLYLPLISIVILVDPDESIYVGSRPSCRFTILTI